MEQKMNQRKTRFAVGYPDSYTTPDQSMTIGEIIERHLDRESIANHANEAIEDTNIEHPMPYDSDLTDTPTRYQDGDYFSVLDRMKRGISTDSLDNNPTGLSPDKTPKIEPKPNSSEPPAAKPADS